MVSIYCGAGKPPNLQEYLDLFLKEVVELTCSGMMHKGVRVYARLTAMIYNAPTRSYVKATVGYISYHACERCRQKGRRIEGRQTFPDLHAPERTDDSFQSQDDPRHHTGVSPFMSLDVDMVALFPTEYMHLACLGVTK